MELWIKIVIVWCLLSVPAALFMGKVIRVGAGRDE